MQRLSSWYRVLSLAFSMALLFAASLIFPSTLLAQAAHSGSIIHIRRNPPLRRASRRLSRTKKKKKSSDPGTVKLRIEVTGAGWKAGR